MAALEKKYGLFYLTYANARGREYQGPGISNMYIYFIFSLFKTYFPNSNVLKGSHMTLNSET
jgi:hypothetical protein